ncbi:mevalonate kinase [Gemmatimonadota bacterium]
MASGPTGVEGRAFARAGLLGNPSDGYSGRTLSVAVRNFEARVTLDEASEIRLEVPGEAPTTLGKLDALVDALARQGYQGAPGRRLLQATLKVFHQHCSRNGFDLGDGGFTARYMTSIPRQAGLAGSSAIVIATLRALQAFYQVDIPEKAQVGLALSAERDELGITAGPQDRVIQVLEGLVYMDFSGESGDGQGHGAYEPLPPSLLPKLYLAYWPEPGEGSGKAHADLRARWERGDEEVCETLGAIADLAATGREALLSGDHEELARLMNRNFDLRRRIMEVQERDVSLAKGARALGASAKLPGSGGSIVGAYPDEQGLHRLEGALGGLGARVEKVQPFSRDGAA